MRKSKKIVAILATLALLATLLVPMVTPAAAATTYSAVTAITPVDPTSDASKTMDLAQVQIKIDPALTGSQASVALIQVKDSNGSLLNILGDATGTGSSSANGTYVASATISGDIISGITPSVTARVYAVNSSADSSYGAPITLKSKTWRVEVASNTNDPESVVRVNLQIKVDANGKAPGDLTVEFFNANGQLINGTVVAGNLSGGTVQVSTVSTGTWSDNGGSVTIRVQESAAGALYLTSNSVKFTLPSGFNWQGTPSAQVIAGSVTAKDAAKAAVSAYVDPNDNRVLKLNLSNAGTVTGPLTIDITATTNVNDPSIAKYGAVNATIGGDSSATTDTVKIGTYGDYGVTVSSVESKTVISGLFDQEIGKFQIKESLKNSLLNGRTIVLTLPENAKWSGRNYPSVSVSDSKDLGTISRISSGDWTQVGTDHRSIKATVSQGTSGSSASGGATIVFKGGKITVAGDYTGEISLTVSGTAGASGTVKVADAVAAVSATSSEKPSVVIGSSVSIGDITITEKTAGAIQSQYHDPDGNNIQSAKLYVDAPSGVTFANVPSVSVESGDIQLGTISKENDDTRIAININATSTTPSTIKVSGLKLVVDRTVPEGDIFLKIGGTAVNENALEINQNNGFSTSTTDYGYTYFANSGYVATVPVATVSTPAPPEKKLETKFVIGQASYTVNGVERTMDVAAYVKDGRTYLPVRYVAQAIGVAPENIIWDSAKNTAILLGKDGRVVSFTIGQKAVVVNGISIPTDAAAEIVDGRTMAPLRAIAQAFGANVSYDEATQTVTVN